MAKTKSQPGKLDPGEAISQIEQPSMNWGVIGLFAVALIVIWVIAGMLMPSIGYWGVGTAAVLTVIALGFFLYVLRLSRKSADIARILRTATDKEGREAALEKLRAKEGKGSKKDVLNLIAQAQLVAQESPGEAIKLLEAVDFKKAPALVHDDVRANLAMLYLRTGRTKDARALTDEIKLDRQPQASAKAMYASVVAEALARTGKGGEALKVVETYDPADKAYAQVRPALLRSRVYVYLAVKKRGRVKETMEQLLAIDPNLLGEFVQRGARPELSRIAKQVLAGAGALPKPKMRMERR